MISALFYENQVYFKPQGKWFVNELKKMWIGFFIKPKSLFSLAQKVGLTKGSVSGDTRFDRCETNQKPRSFVRIYF